MYGTPFGSKLITSVIRSSFLDRRNFLTDHLHSMLYPIRSCGFDTKFFLMGLNRWTSIDDRSIDHSSSPIWIIRWERGGTRLGCYQNRYTETWTGVITVFFVAQEWDFACMKPVGRQRSFLKRNTLNLYKRLVSMKNGMEEV